MPYTATRLPARCAMKIIKNIFSKFYLYLLWTMFALMFVGWIFMIITDTSSKNKVTVYADVISVDDLELRIELEKSKPDYIKMVKVHPFSYVAFSSSSILNGDIYIIKQSDAEEYLASFSPLTQNLCSEYSDRGLYLSEGVAYGIKVYDALTASGCASRYINYSPLPDAEAEDYYLFFNKDSLHAGGLNGSANDAALVVANALISL